MNHVVLAVAGLLADEAPLNRGPDFGKASPVGLLVIVLLLLGTFALVWSMNRQLKKVPASFDPEHPAPDQAADPGTVGAVDEPADEAASSRETPARPD